MALLEIKCVSGRLRMDNRCAPKVRRDYDTGVLFSYPDKEVFIHRNFIFYTEGQRFFVSDSYGNKFNFLPSHAKLTFDEVLQKLTRCQSPYADVVTDDTLIGKGDEDSPLGVDKDKFIEPGDDVSELNNDAGYLTLDTLPDINDGELDITTGDGLEGSGKFTANQAGDTVIEIAIDKVTIDKINHGETAFGWGDHSVEGYLKADDITGKEDKVNKVTDLDNPNNTTYPTTKAVNDAIQDVDSGIVQSDWKENDSSDRAFIRNKPTKVSDFNIDINTDDIDEGSNNLFFTDQRVSSNSDVSANTAARHTHANKSLLDSYDQTNEDISDAVTHKDLTDNPHSVTASQIGLGNVDNTSDADKPVSTAQGVAIQGAETNAKNYTDQKIGSLSTDDISEGSNNLFFTNQRVSSNSDVSANTAARHTHANLDALNNITDTGSGNQFLSNDGTYKEVKNNVQADWSQSDSTEDDFIKNKPENVSEFNIDISTDDIDEGSNNLFFTNARVQSQISAQVTKQFIDNLGVDAATLNGKSDTDFISVTDKGVANGVATLNSQGKLTNSQVPAIAITETFEAADINERDQLPTGTGEGVVGEGDVVIVVDASSDPEVDEGGATYIYDGQEYKRLITPTESVSSVNGQKGVVVLSSDDIDEGSNNLFFTNARVTNHADVSANTAARHTHANLDALNNITDSGDGDKYLSDDGSYKVVKDNVQSDWSQTNNSQDDYIKNKPTKVSDFQIDIDTDDISEGSNRYYTDSRVNSNPNVSANTAARHTHNNKDALDDIINTGSGNLFLSDDGSYKSIVENIQSDWDQSDSSEEDYIKNKPTKVSDFQIDIDSDDIDEGSNNLFFTNARVTNHVDVSANTAARHTHANKTLLDSLTDSGDGDKFLSDDGTYAYPEWGNISGSIGDQSDLQSALNSKADSSHTHTASDITDFNSAVSSNTDVTNAVSHTTRTDNPHNVTAAQVGVNKAFVDNLGVDAATLNGKDDTDFASSAQGGLADTALQPGDNISELVNDKGYADEEYVDTKYSDIVDTYLGVVVHGDSSNEPRPSDYASIVWIGSATPANAEENDIWIEDV